MSLKTLVYSLPNLAFIGAVDRMFRLAGYWMHRAQRSYAEHLLEQRNQGAQAARNRRAARQIARHSLWDISGLSTNPSLSRNGRPVKKGLDVLAFSGPDLNKLKQAADMAEVINSLDRWLACRKPVRMKRPMRQQRQINTT